MLDPDTATPINSIWHEIDRDQFEETADELEALKYRAAPWAQARTDWPEDDDRYPIPYAVERQLADDFAYISACEPKVVTVTAATIETSENPPGITVRLAGNKGIRDYVQVALDKVLQNLECCARKEISQKECAEDCLEIVVRLNMNRLFKRIGSRHFEKPKHLALYAKGPISPQWNRLMLKPVQRKPDAIKLAAEAEEFNSAFEQLEETNTEDEKVVSLIDLVKRSFAFTIDGRSLQGRLEKAGYGKKTFATRPFREINKTAAYWRICCNLSGFARLYRRFFQSLTLIPIEHYNSSTRPGKEEERFIHAEVQVITYYETTNATLWPRALGTSKKACFLCYQFIRYHGCFNVSKSHGIVFSRWAVPDRKDYSPDTLKRLRGTLKAVEGRVREELEKAGMGRIKQDDPVQSSIDLNYFSIPNGSAASLQSAGSSTSTYARKDLASHEQVDVVVDQRAAVNSLGLSTPTSLPSRNLVPVSKSFLGYLKRLFRRLTDFGSVKDFKPDGYTPRSEALDTKGKQRAP